MVRMTKLEQLAEAGDSCCKTAYFQICISLSLLATGRDGHSSNPQRYVDHTAEELNPLFVRKTLARNLGKRQINSDMLMEKSSARYMNRCFANPGAKQR